jgi:hypothetical protein
MKLNKIAHSRSGDKGDYSLVTAIVYDQKDYEIIREKLTVALVKKKYGDLVEGTITRFECPNLGMLIFQMERALGGGVTRSLRHDGHGKNMSNAMMDIDLPD